MKIYCDGFCKGGNPSKIGGGCVVFNGEYHKKEVFKGNFTNNEAELLGILEAAKIAEDGDEIYTDSFCASCWVVKGKSKVRPDLNFLMKEAKELLQTKDLKLFQIPREENLAGIYIENNKTGNETAFTM